MNQLKKSKRGFSLVELMVVVAIMGTLAAIAIPAYNEYRKSAKKTAYKTDGLAVHKGWQAFGVELDSYCERETLPSGATLSAIGMESLYSSKLYGERATTPIPGACAAVGTATCATATTYSSCVSSCTGTCNAANYCEWTPADQKNGPGKSNFVGFATEACANMSSTTNIHLKDTQQDTACDLRITGYELGVYRSYIRRITTLVLR